MKLCGLCNKRKVVKHFGAEGTRCKKCIKEAVEKVVNERQKSQMIVTRDWKEIAWEDLREGRKIVAIETTNRNAISRFVELRNFIVKRRDETGYTFSAAPYDTTIYLGNGQVRFINDDASKLRGLNIHNAIIFPNVSEESVQLAKLATRLV